MTHRFIQSALILAVALCFSACMHSPASTSLRIDGSTPESFNSSWNRLYRSLNSRQQSQLAIAILPIALGKYKSILDVPPEKLAGIGPQDIRTQIDGMSYEQIIAMARAQPVKVSTPNHP